MPKETQRDYELRLDNLMVFYLSRRSVSTWEQISNHFELHPDEDLNASIHRLTVAGRVRFDERRNGWATCAAPAKEG